MQIEINQEEREFLTECLRRDYQDLREEIYKTEDFRFKSDLRRKERLIESLLGKLAPEEVAKSA